MHFWRKHFNLKNFAPIHDNPRVFVTSQWHSAKEDDPKPNMKYLYYRIFIALMFLITWVISICKKPTSEKWPIFLTNWGYTICTLQALLALLMVSFYIISPYLKTQSDLGQIALKMYPIYWILNTTATSIAFGISIIYWLVIYKPESPVSLMNYFVHGNNSVLMLIDLGMVGHPVRLFHCIYPALAGLVYTIFSVIYYAAGGTSRDGTRYIYKILDWDLPVQTSLVCVGVTILILVIHILVFACYKFRNHVHRKCWLEPLHSDINLETREPAAYDNKAMATDAV